jgi:hypothetical protein
LIDAGYQIRIDSAVEDERDARADVSVPLTSTRPCWRKCSVE